MTSCSSRLSTVPARNSSRSLRLGAAVLGIEDQWLLAALSYPLFQEGHNQKTPCDVWFLADVTPGYELVSLDIDQQVKVQPYPLNGGRQIGDISAPYLIRSCGPQAWYSSRLLWWRCSTTTIGLPVCMDHPVSAALLADVQATVR